MALASRGLRDMDDGPEAIEDDEERAQVGSQARTVHMKSVAVAAVLTALAFLAPV